MSDRAADLIDTPVRVIGCTEVGMLRDLRSRNGVPHCLVEYRRLSARAGAAGFTAVSTSRWWSAYDVEPVDTVVDAKSAGVLIDAGPGVATGAREVTAS